MTDLPFGFGASSGPGPDEAGDWAGKAPLFAELQKLMSWSGGPVNWDLARQLAISQIAAGDRPVTVQERSAVEQAMRLADLWLDPLTSLPSGVRAGVAWSRVEWIERTLPVWSTLCDPVAERVVAAMGGALPSEAQAEAGALMGMLGQAGGLMFGAQVGQALAGLSGDVLGATDIGLPLGPPGMAALLPANVEAFGAGLELPADDVRVYLALRETAHHRLFGSVPWLRQHLLEAVDAYARGITIDSDALESAMHGIDPQNPESLQEALGSGMFEPQDTPQQQASLARLETALALVEGWVHTVVSEAAGERLPSAAALGETLRRRRASGGPSEQTFATLVGLELRPRRLREAATMWAAVQKHKGAEGRDELWVHPDLLPSAADLDDPTGFAERPQEDLKPPQES
ncbi:MAG: zinc-dependent metalloprotease [Mycobacteriales bacterium]